MFLNGKPYIVNLQGVSISTAITFIEIVASATRPLIIYEANLTQEGSTTSANAVVQIVRKSGAATGGTAFTPIPLAPNQGASGFTAKIQGGTAFSAEGTISDNLDRFGFNVLNGWNWQPTPDGVLWVAPSGIISLKFPSAPAAQNWTANVKVMEIG